MGFYYNKVFSYSLVFYLFNNFDQEKLLPLILYNFGAGFFSYFYSIKFSILDITKSLKNKSNNQSNLLYS